MFRKMLRSRQQLQEEDCIALLIREPRGVLSMLGDDDYPYGIPMNHWYCEADGKLYFHCGKKGHKLDALRRHAKVSFCVYDEGFRKEGEWALNIASVVAFGRMRIVDDPERVVEVTRQLSYKYTQDADYIEREIAQFASATLLLEMTIDHMTGKLVNES